VPALAAAIERVVADTSHRHGLVEAGHRNLERFSWDRCAEELLEVYRLAIEEQP
jgi:glycosyltransferase involved in cell wall biosynthesis